MSTRKMPTRRRFLADAAAAGGGALLAGCGGREATSDGEQAAAGKVEEVTPGEDLMREHGLLRRVLLVYQDCAGRIEAGGGPPPAAVKDAAGIIRRYIESYHEVLEEKYLFPRFEQAGKMADLVATLRTQHAAGRALTTDILRRADGAADRAALAAAMRAFIRMYRPHAAREDTVLFPAFRGLVSPDQYEEIGERFEEIEHATFGEGGFAKTVEQVAAIEKTLGIHDLARFTPGGGRA